MTRKIFYSLLLTFNLALANSSTAWALTEAAVDAGSAISPKPAVTHAEQDGVQDIWLVDTRHGNASCCSTDPLTLGVEQYAGSCRWETRSLDELLVPSAQPHGTIIFVHGNRVSAGEAKQEGLQVYRALKQQAGDGGDFRLVIFSWPADRVHGQIADVRLKAARTAPAAFVLSELLAQTPADEPVGLVGFSLGSRIISGSLQLLAGGQLGCYTLGDRRVEPRPGMRVVLIAPALHSHWLWEGQHMGLAVTQMDRLLLLNNSCDPALKRYRVLERCSDPAALGYVGLAEHRLVDSDVEVEQIDACCKVGRTHSLGRFLCNGCLMSRAWHHLEVRAPDSIETDSIETASAQPIAGR